MSGRDKSRIRIFFAALTNLPGPIGITVLHGQVAPSVPVNTSVGPAYDWNGWYVGGQVGYSQGNVNATVSAPVPIGSSIVLGRGDGGLHAGYNAVLPSRFLLGAEADVSFPGFFEDGTVLSTSTPEGSNVTEKIDFVSTLRGRLGYTSDLWQVYGTGGLALSQMRFFESSASSSAEQRVQVLSPGWALGAGAEFALTRGWSARVEYLYGRLGQAAGTFPSGTSVESKADLHSLRLGFSLNLGRPGAPAPVSRTTSSSGYRSSRGSGRSGDSDVPTAAEGERWNIHGQATFIDQGYVAFRSPYEGTNSLTGSAQLKNTLSITGFVGLRLWPGGEMYFNPEIDQGFGLNDTHGVAAFPNGEAQKASFPMPRFVVDRLFVRQTFGLGGEQETLADGSYQLAGRADISRITVVAGRLAVTDYFDGNAYADDPRTNFLNWNIYGAGAYDWTMDQISWTWGALADLNQKDWAFRIGYFLLPVVSSNNSYDMHIPEHGEYTAELERRYSLGSRPGKVRVFGWVNHGTMGGYADAIALPTTSPGYPDITLTRKVRTNPGVVLNLEQAITSDLGVFSRFSWSPGLTEILGGTDCSQSWSLGAVLNGRWWGRPEDGFGLGGVIGGLSPEARAYFAAGGLGILIGDGQLDYRHEKVLETYYAYAPAKWARLTFDYQFVVNPGYNADRGPVPIYALRFHTAF